MLTSTIKNAHDIVRRLVEEYGQRALAAERNEGLDWKALSHAVRVGHEAVELFQTGRISFPRPEAKHLLEIKCSQIPYVKVAGEIEQLLVDVEVAASNSSLPEKADSACGFRSFRPLIPIYPTSVPTFIRSLEPDFRRHVGDYFH